MLVILILYGCVGCCCALLVGFVDCGLWCLQFVLFCLGFLGLLHSVCLLSVFVGCGRLCWLFGLGLGVWVLCVCVGCVIDSCLNCLFD